jgi:hypothetical protein
MTTKKRTKAKKNEQKHRATKARNKQKRRQWISYSVTAQLFSKGLSYSALRASIGSIFAARRQGREVAATAARAKMQTMGRMTVGSAGEVP